MNIDKLIQVVGYLLNKNNGKMNYTKLIKLLYLADKESYKAINRSITGDNYISMKNGPVLSTLYYLISNNYNNKNILDLWNKYFITNKYDLIQIEKNINDSELSRFEKRTLEALDLQFKESDFIEMITFVHDKKNCPEWENPKVFSKPITEKAILRSIGRTNEEIKSILEEEKQYQKEEKILNSLSAIVV